MSDHLTGGTSDDAGPADLRASYSLSTAQRISLLSSVTRQTASMANESKNVLESCLSSQQSIKDAKAMFEAVEVNVMRRRARLRQERDQLEKLKRIRDQRSQEVVQKREDIMQRFQGLKDVVSSLTDLRSRLDSERQRLSSCQEDLERRRAFMIRELVRLIYPINVPVDSGQSSWNPPSIGGFHLPDTRIHPQQQQHSNLNSSISISSPSSSWTKSWSQSMFGNQRQGVKSLEITEEEVSIAVGHVVHLILLISKFADIPLKYDLEFYGSRSHIIDHLNIGTWKQILGHPSLSSMNSSQDQSNLRSNQILGRKREGVQVSLFVSSKGSKDSRVYFNYGMYLMNQVIGQLKWTISSMHKRHVNLMGSLSSSDVMSIKRIDLTKTLGNINDILLIYCNLLNREDNRDSSLSSLSLPSPLQTINPVKSSGEETTEGEDSGQAISLTVSTNESSEDPFPSFPYKRQDADTFLAREMEAMLRTEQQPESNGQTVSHSTKSNSSQAIQTVGKE